MNLFCASLWQMIPNKANMMKESFFINVIFMFLCA